MHNYRIKRNIADKKELTLDIDDLVDIDDLDIDDLDIDDNKTSEMNNKPKLAYKKKKCPCGNANRLSRCIYCNPNCGCPHHPTQLKERCNICKPDHCKIEEHNVGRKNTVKKSRCDYCNPNRRCNHNKIKLNCRICNPDRFCQIEGHISLKATCRLCGKRKCGHERNGIKIDKDQCRICSPVAFCPCDRAKDACIKCNGSQICKHNKRKTICVHCNGGYLCKHGKQKQECKNCGGVNYCACNILKKYCIEHGGNGLCVKCKINYGRKRFRSHCTICFKIDFPNEHKLIAKATKVKEHEVVKSIKLKFPSLTIVHDKIIKNSNSLKRPDIFIDMGLYVIIVEIDEHKHCSYNNENEKIRILEIKNSITPKSLIVIRFNPDSYVNKHGERIKSCWDYGQDGLIVTKIEDWDYRLECLFNEIDYHINNHPVDNFCEVTLFFNQKLIIDDECM